MGHAFGLEHVEGNDPKARKRVMWEGSATSSKGFGKAFTAGECKSIMDEADKYPCPPDPV